MKLNALTKKSLNVFNIKEIQKEVENADRIALEKHYVGVREIRFIITENMDDSWDI